jgi:hypothetical protein
MDVRIKLPPWALGFYEALAQQRGVSLQDALRDGLLAIAELVLREGGWNEGGVRWMLETPPERRGDSIEQMSKMHGSEA